jgi:protein SCO1/2
MSLELTQENPQHEPTPPPAPKTESAFGAGNLAFFGMLAVLALLAVGLALWTASKGNIGLRAVRSQPLPVLGTVPEFALTERSGVEFGSESLKGRIWIADFIFTRCAGTCPTMSGNMEVLQRALERIPELHPPAVLVSFTVDPENDTPEVLQKYAEFYNAEGPQWLFLTGEYDELQKLAIEGFKLGVQHGYDSEIEPIIHSQSFVLVDKKGQIRGYYDGTEDTTMRKVLADVQKLIRER